MVDTTRTAPPTSPHTVMAKIAALNNSREPPTGRPTIRTTATATATTTGTSTSVPGVGRHSNAVASTAASHDNVTDVTRSAASNHPAGGAGTALITFFLHELV